MESRRRASASAAGGMTSTATRDGGRGNTASGSRGGGGLSDGSKSKLGAMLILDKAPVTRKYLKRQQEQAQKRPADDSLRATTPYVSAAELAQQRRASKAAMLFNKQMSPGVAPQSPRRPLARLTSSNIDGTASATGGPHPPLPPEAFAEHHLQNLASSPHSARKRLLATLRSTGISLLASTAISHLPARGPAEVAATPTAGSQRLPKSSSPRQRPATTPSGLFAGMAGDLQTSRSGYSVGSMPTGALRSTRRPTLRAGVPKRVEEPGHMSFDSPKRRTQDVLADTYSAFHSAQAVDLDGETVTLVMSPPRHALRSAPEEVSHHPLRHSDHDSAPAKQGPVKKKSIVDYQLLSKACARAGRTRMEGQAHYGMAVLLEQQGQLHRAADAYRKFLSISRKTRDMESEVLALNSLGIVCQTIGDPPHLEEAIQHHEDHGNLCAQDAHGRFISHINLGLCFQALGDHERAMIHHKEALAHAVRLGNVDGESCALANIAHVGTHAGDLNTAKACMERHLSLSETLQDHHGGTDAVQELAFLAVREGDSGKAVQLFDAARTKAKATGQHSVSRKASVHIGITAGSAKYDEFMRGMAQQLST